MSCQHGVPCNTWILIRRSTGEVVAEVDQGSALISHLNPERVDLIRPCEHLARLNRDIREGKRADV